jgi:glycosyltransferase involved in cell wall biosynthesis
VTGEAAVSQLEFLSCFFPAFNEEANLPKLLDDALVTLPQFAARWEAIVVDDGSSDHTAEIVRDYEARHPEIRLVQHAKNLGYGHALRSGFEASRGTAVFFTDADLQFHLTDISLLLPAFAEADIVVGYRIKRRDPWRRLAVARVYHVALQAMFGLHLRDIDCAFKLVDRSVVDKLLVDLESRSAFISPEMIIRAQLAGMTIQEVGIEHYPRTAGKPKGATPTVIARTIGEMVRLRGALRGAQG